MNVKFRAELLLVLGLAVMHNSYAQSAQESESIIENTDSALFSGSARQVELLDLRTAQLEELRLQISGLSDQQKVVEAQKNELANANDEIKNLNETLTRLQNDFTEKTENADVVESKMTSMQKKIENLETLLFEKEKLLSTMSMRIDKEEKKSESVSEINKAYFNLQEAHKALNEKWVLQKGESKSAAELAATYKQKITELEQDLTSSRENLRKTEESSVSAELLEQTREEKRSIEATAAALQQQVSKMEAQYKALEEKQPVTADSSDQNLELQKTQRRVVVLEAELENLRGANSQLEKKLAESKVLSERAAEPIIKQEVVSEPVAKTDSEATVPKESNSSLEVEIPVVAGSRQASKYVLGSDWSINIGSNGPDDYIDLAAVRQLNEQLPDESDCQDFVQQFNNDSTLLEKLSVNGFPVTVFWIKRASGAFAICKIDKSSANIFRASVSRTTPSRADKAIVPKIQ